MLPKKDYVFCIEIKIKDAQPIKTDVISQIHIINFLQRLQKKTICKNGTTIVRQRSEG